MARTPTPKPPEAEIHYPPPTTGGAFRRLPGGELEPEVKTPPPATPAEQPPTNQAGE